MTKEKLKEIQRKNNLVIGKYHALALENADKQKCLITFTGLDETYRSTVKIRKVFIDKIHSILKRKKCQEYTFKYFSTIEFSDFYKSKSESMGKGKWYNPHIHFQCYHDNIAIVNEAFEYTIKKLNLNISKCHILESEDDTQAFFYVIKSYLPNGFDDAVQEMKERIYKGKVMYWCSRKEFPDYLIKKLFNVFAKLDKSTKDKPKFPYMLKLIREKKLIIKKLAGNSEDNGYIKVKKWGFTISLNEEK
jgi:hypothetical protein